MYLCRDTAKLTTKKIPLGPVHTPRRFSFPIPILEYDYVSLRGTPVSICENDRVVAAKSDTEFGSLQTVSSIM